MQCINNVISLHQALGSQLAISVYFTYEGFVILPFTLYLIGVGEKKLEFELFLPEGELMVGPRHVSNVCLKNDQNPYVWEAKSYSYLSKTTTTGLEQP